MVEGSLPSRIHLNQGSDRGLGGQEEVFPVNLGRGVSGSGEIGHPGAAATVLAGGLSAVDLEGHSSLAVSSGNGTSLVRNKDVGGALVEKSASSRRKKNWIKKK